MGADIDDAMSLLEEKATERGADAIVCDSSGATGERGPCSWPMELGYRRNSLTCRNVASIVWISRAGT